jgi:glycosyltransferase involved in cell wall biosynthesis
MRVNKAKLDAMARSGLFDARWYAERYPDVGLLGMDPAEHFLRIGARLERDPGPRFDTAYYLASNPDVVRARMNPLLHYITHGRDEGRACQAPRAVGVPAPALPEAEPAFDRLPVQTYPGRRARIEDAPTVLVCAHVSGKHLFGGERSLLDILDGLADAGLNAVVTTPGISNPDYLKALRDRSLAVCSFRYGWWRRDVAVDQNVVAAFALLVQEHGIGAVHANTIMLREPLLAARRMGVPAVVHVRELIHHDQALIDLIGEAPERIVEQVLAGADWIVANSEATARAFHKDGVTRVVPNTIDTAAFDLPAPAAEGALRVVMVSSNLPKKGTLDFVAVARLLQDELPEARFLLIGPDNAHVEALKEQQAAGEVPDNVVFAGYRDDPAKAVAEADLLLNLSHFQESFGRTVLEAMTARRPVVVYDWGALPELVADGETGAIAPFRDVAAVARRIVELARDRSRLRAVGEAARARAVATYGKPAYAQRMRELYRDVVAAATPQKVTLPARRPRIEAGETLRIAYFLWHFPVPSETFVLNELRILVAQGHDVQVFCKQSPYKDFKPDFPITWTRVADVDDLARQLTETGRTMVHSHFTYPTVTDMVWPACEKARVPFTFIAHAQDIFRYANDEKNRIGEIGQSPWCLRVVVPSRFHRDYVESRGVPPSKLFINPNGCDPELYAAGRDPARARRTRRSICAIHRFTEKKGLVHLIRAGRALADDGVSIHLYGYGELENDYREQIAAEGLRNVHLHGPVKSREDMLALFAEHDLFACPSVRAADGDMDGIPTVLMEAMAAGLPVLTTAASGIPDLVQDEVTGIVCEPDAESIAAAVRRYYALSDAQVAAIIEDAQALIERDYHAGRLTNALLRLWQGRRVDVMIVSWNNLPQLREVVRRLYKYTSLPFHLVICDNGSAGDVGAFLCEAYAAHDNLTVVFNRDNALVGPGTNICMRHGDADYAVYVCGKEGFVLDYGWEKSLVQYMDEHPKVGLGGTVCHSPSYLTGAQYPQAIALFDKFRNPRFATDNPTRKFGHVQGGFFVIRRAMFDAIGGFSDEVPHNYTDVEYSYYVESCGWELGTPPRLLALFNKTRPGLFSRVDESVAATHPPMLEDLPLLDRIARRQGAHCNVCGWHGEAFEERGAGAACGGCGSLPADRSLYRFLAESMLTYRRLPALGVGVGPAMEAIWRHQFQGQLHAPAAFAAQLRAQGKLDFRPGSLKFVYLDGVLDGGEGDAAALREVDRVLARDGLLLVRWPGASAAQVEAMAGACALHGIEPVRFSSRVVRYDALPLLVGRRSEAAQCVS